MADDAALNRAKEHFARLVEDQPARVDRLKIEPNWLDYRLAALAAEPAPTTPTICSRR